VSIVTPILNGREFLDECIQSVLEQNYSKIEHIFVDGGSVDGSCEALAAYQAKFATRIRIIAAPGTGPGEAWNIGLKAARGEIFGSLGSDDVYEVGAIDTMVDFFRSTPEACFLHGACDLINEHGVIVGRHRVRPFNLKAFVNTAAHIATISAFYKRIVMERVNWLDESGDDFDLMIRIAREFRLYDIDVVLSKLRIHADSAFNPRDFTKRKAVYRQTYQVSRRYGGDLLSIIALKYYGAVLISLFHLEPLYPPLRSTFRRALELRRAFDLR